MNWSYKNWLKEKLAFVSQDLKITDITFDVVDEQEYAKKEYYSPDTVYVVIKKYNGSVAFKTTVQPVQIMVLSEQFTLENTTNVLTEFVRQYQYEVTNIRNEDNSYTYVKHDYQKPAVMSNFIEVGAGRRSILYIPANLYILENNLSLIHDVQVKINDGEFENIEVVSLSINYNMQGNTQQLPSKHLSETVKSVAISSLSIVVQAISNSLFISNMLDVMFGRISGNLSYTFSFEGGKSFTMKLSNAEYTDAPNAAPSLQLGFTV